MRSIRDNKERFWHEKRKVLRNNNNNFKNQVIIAV